MLVLYSWWDLHLCKEILKLSFHHSFYNNFIFLKKSPLFCPNPCKENEVVNIGKKLCLHTFLFASSFSPSLALKLAYYKRQAVTFKFCVCYFFLHLFYFHLRITWSCHDQVLWVMYHFHFCEVCRFFFFS